MQNAKYLKYIVLLAITSIAIFNDVYLSPNNNLLVHGNHEDPRADSIFPKIIDFVKILHSLHRNDLVLSSV